MRTRSLPLLSALIVGLPLSATPGSVAQAQCPTSGLCYGQAPTIFWGGSAGVGCSLGQFSRPRLQPGQLYYNYSAPTSVPYYNGNCGQPTTVLTFPPSGALSIPPGTQPFSPSDQAQSVLSNQLQILIPERRRILPGILQRRAGEPRNDEGRT